MQWINGCETAVNSQVIIIIGNNHEKKLISLLGTLNNTAEAQ